MLHSFVISEGEFDRICSRTPDLDRWVYTVQPSLVDDRLVVLVECSDSQAAWLLLQITG